jgi:hypothetical protein
MSKIQPNFGSIYRIFGLVVVVLLIFLGFSLIFSKYFQYIPSNLRFFIGVFVVSYGAFRLVNIILKFKNQTNEDDEE